MTKYSNIKTVIDGYTFASKKEANRYCELKLLVKAKEIKDLILQPKFELQPSFTDDSGEKHKAIFYIGDFSYSDRRKKWETVVEDCKGFKTEVYRLKKKLFLYRYPVHFIET